MAYRAIDVKIMRIDIDRNRLTIRRRKIRTGKIRHLKTVFIVDRGTLVTTKDNCTIAVSDIKPSSRATIDFIKTEDKKLLAKGISILG